MEEQPMWFLAFSHVEKECILELGLTIDYIKRFTQQIAGSIKHLGV